MYTEDLWLLKNDPDKLVVKHQQLITTIVKSFVKSGLINNFEFDDLVQHVYEELLIKSKYIRNQFQNLSTFRTYLTVVIRNICLGYARMKKNLVYEELGEYEATTASAIDQMVLQDEMTRLDQILDLYGRKRKKVELCLKVKFKVSVTKEDFLEYSSRISDEVLNSSLFRLSRHEDSDSERLEILSEIINECERKSNSSDAIRKWIDIKRLEIINLLNGTPPTRRYDNKSLLILVDLYYSQS